MTQVDFYVLSASTPAARNVFACRLTEKAWKAGHRVFIRVSDASEATILDDLLWTFRQGSFVPHTLVDNYPNDPLVAALIGTGHPPEGFQELLINLSSEPPQDWEKFLRIAEIVVDEENIRREGRNRFRFYQAQGLKPITHQLD